MLYDILRSSAFILLKALFRFKVKGREHIPKEGGFILASNHVSYLDPIALSAACPRKLNFMAKEELFRNRLFSWLISTVGSFPVKRDSADLSALREAMRRLKKGSALLLFPEGSRRFDPPPEIPGLRPGGDERGFVQKGREPRPSGRGGSTGVSEGPYPGIGFLASKLAVPVVPAFVSGTDKAMPGHVKSIRLCKINVCFGEKIFVERRMPYQDISRLIMQSIKHLAC